MYPGLSGSGRTSPLLGRSQSQTIRDNSNVEPQLGADLDYNFEDSDEGEKERPQTPPQSNMLSPPPTRRKRKSERLQPDRRVTINWTRDENNTYRCMLRDNTKTLAKEFSFASLEDFLHLMESGSGELFATVKHVLEAYQSMDSACEALQEDLAMTTSDMEKLETRVEAQKQKLADLSREHEQRSLQANELERILTSKEEEIAKLRRSRNAHRDNFDKINTKAKSLMLDKETMQKTIEGLERRLEFARPYLPSEDSDRESGGQALPRSNRPPGEASHVRLLRRGEPMPTSQYEHHRQENEVAIAPPKHKYPELPIFYGDTEEWESWKAHLITKVQTDYYDFPTEWHKVNYARDRTKGTAQANIWHRAKPDTVEPYETLDQLIEDLDNVYGEEEQDKQRNLLQQLFSPSFAMGVKDRSESFEKFLARFTSTVSPLRLTDNEKITHLFRNLSEQLTERIYHLNGVAKYSDYVKGVRQAANQMKVRNEMRQSAATSTATRGRRTRAAEDMGRKETSFRKAPRNKSKTREHNAMEDMISKLPAHIRAKLRKAGRCFKCGAAGHMSTDPDAPCQGRSHITREKAEALLSEMGIEWTDADFEYFEDPGSEPEYLEEDDAQEERGPTNSKN